MMATVAVFLLAASAMAAAQVYVRTWRMVRPPLGTINLGDVTLTLGCIVLVPALYLWLPGWLVGTLLALITLSLLWTVVEPIITSPRARTAVAGGLVAADMLLVWRDGTASHAFLLVNDVVILAVAVGVSNLWAQCGLRARDLAILSGAIAIYDLVATGFLPITTDLIERLSGMPFLPVVAWPTGSGQWVGIGLGDLLMAAAGPLVMRKAFGHAAGNVATAIALGAIGAILLVARWDALPETFPTMIVLGPLMVAHYMLWARRAGSERTWARYLTEDPLRTPRAVADTASPTARPGYRSA